jgi:RNA polymerase sigma factor (TIGR02999 family)
VDPIDSLIARVNAGEPGAQDALFTTAYAELRGLARARLQGGGRNTCLDTTALVHESFLRFIRHGQLRNEDRRAFFSYASRIMRSVIIDSVRERQAQVRGGGLEKLTLDTQLVEGLPAGEDELLRVDEALQALAQSQPRLAQVVEMRYFGGYTDVEVAEALGLNEKTIRRDWDKARLLLTAMLAS